MDAVLSEVHLACGHGCTVSCFTIGQNSPGKPMTSTPGNEECGHLLESGVDGDGDLVLPRRSNAKLASDRPADSIVIYHSMATALPLVGLQVWRGALLLTDFIIHKSKTSADFDNVTAVEFGCGTGVAGIALARLAKLVFMTDKGDDVLDNCSRNVFANSASFRHGESTVKVKELDWSQGWPPQTTEARTSRYLWNQDDLKDVESATVFLAADVIYSDDLTDALFDILSRMLPRGSNKILYLGLEKRYNFSMDAVDVVANGYANFLAHLSAEGQNKQTAGFCGRRLDGFTIPKYITEYDRSTDLELWEICAAPPV